MSLISVEAAIGRLCQTSSVRVGEETAALEGADGRVLAHDIHAGLNVPPADNSAMDGYALRRQDWHGPDVSLPVSQRITAGSTPEALQAGTAARIFTGAEVPVGADVVVMQEKCRSDGRNVWMENVGRTGANIRRKGQDIAQGAVVLKAGHRLRCQDLGLIASLGIAEANVMKPLSVAVISTGAELVEPGDHVRPGQIYNSNRYMLSGLLKGWGFRVLDFGIVEDSAAALREVMIEASEKSDTVITTGGVSVGEEDHVKPVVESLGSIDLWRVAIKPGKPFAFGEVRGTPFLGLPGNPASVLVTALIMARPFLFDCQGIRHHDIVPIRQVSLFDKPAGTRQDYLRVRRRREGVEIFPQQSSGALYSASWGDGLVVQKPGETIRHGEPVDVIPYSMFN